MRIKTRAYIATRLCRILPASLAYRLQFAFFPDLIGSDVPFLEKTLFGAGQISGTLRDAVEASFAIHGTANLEGMVVASFYLRPGDTVYEFGANVGTETLALAGLVGSHGKVLAVEADPENSRLLSERVSANGFSQVTVITKAVSNSFEPLYLHRSGRTNSGMSFVTTLRTETQEEAIPAVTPDRLLSEHGAPKLILMDLEGAEYNALLGSAELLESSRPVIVCEVDREFLERLGASPAALFDYLSEKRYRMFGLNDVRMPSISLADIGKNYHGDWLALPVEKANEDSQAIRRALFRARWLPKIKHLNPLWC